MNFRTVLLALAATSALSTAAFAAVSNPHETNHPSSREQLSDRCAALESQYDSVIEGRMGAPKADTASSLHAQGVDQCNTNETDTGAQKLQQALRVLGVKPAA